MLYAEAVSVKTRVLTYAIANNFKLKIDGQHQGHGGALEQCMCTRIDSQLAMGRHPRWD